MTLLPHFTTFSLRPRTLSMSFTPFSPGRIHTTTSRPKPTSAELLPARDRVIDFGKHKGRMLGTLPSKYLTWVSNNLRARDFEEWAKLADEVLRDPVYRDRVEWESVERVLSGEGVGSGGSRESPVWELLEISERFGWDNQDKEGWKRVDFELLGTSKGGRIPRRRRRGGGGGVLEGSEETGFGREGWETAKERKPQTFGSAMFDRGKQLEAVDGKKMELPKDRKVGFLSKGHRIVMEEEQELVGGKKEERRERQRIKRDQQMRNLRKEVGVVERGGGNNGGMKKEQIGGSGGPASPFPGRDALLGRITKKP